MNINVWLGMRADADTLLKTRITWDEELMGPYSGPITQAQAAFFSKMADRDVVQHLFRTDRVAGKDWKLWSVYIDSKKVGAALLQLIADYPNHLKVGGAWHWDGRQVGTQFVYEDVTRDVQVDDPDVEPPMVDDPRNDQWNTFPQIIDPDFDWPQITIQVTSNEVTGTSGTPKYPLHSRLIQFMPDIAVYNQQGELVSTKRPTELSDTNLRAGQAPRRFT